MRGRPGWTHRLTELPTRDPCLAIEGSPVRHFGEVDFVHLLATEVQGIVY